MNYIDRIRKDICIQQFAISIKTCFNIDDELGRGVGTGWEEGKHLY